MGRLMGRAERPIWSPHLVGRGPARPINFQKSGPARPSPANHIFKRIGPARPGPARPGSDKRPMTSLETIMLWRTSSFCSAYGLSFNTTKSIIGDFEDRRGYRSRISSPARDGTSLEIETPTRLSTPASRCQSPLPPAQLVTIYIAFKQSAT